MTNPYEILNELKWRVTGLLIFISCLFFYFYFSGLYYSKKYPSHSSDKNHHAIIMAHKSGIFSIIDDTIYADGIDLLIKFFLKNNKYYKVYRCNNSSDFKKVLKNKKAIKLWIFGHGTRHSIKFSKDDILHYCDVQKYPRKNYIAQFHCNHNGGKSLADYLSPTNNFVDDAKRYLVQNRLDVPKELRKMFLK